MWITNVTNCIISEKFIVIFDSSCFRLVWIKSLLNLLHSLGFQLVENSHWHYTNEAHLKSAGINCERGI